MKTVQNYKYLGVVLDEHMDFELNASILAEMDTMDWDIKRYKSEKLRYYNLYKYDSTPAEYVMMNISKYQRS